MEQSEHTHSSKPMIERRRRARINQLVAEIKLHVTADVEGGPGHVAKMDKAEILDAAVDYMKKRQTPAPVETNTTTPYRAGFIECTSSIVNFLARDDSVDVDTKIRLLSHLTNYLVHSEDTQKSKLAYQTVPKPAALHRPTAIPWSRLMSSEITTQGQVNALHRQHQESLWNMHTQAHKIPHRPWPYSHVQSSHSMLTSPGFAFNSFNHRTPSYSSEASLIQAHLQQQIRARSTTQTIPPHSSFKTPASSVELASTSRCNSTSAQPSRSVTPIIAGDSRHLHPGMLSVHPSESLPARRQAFMPIDKNIMNTQSSSKQASKNVRYEPYQKYGSVSPNLHKLKRATKRLDFNKYSMEPSHHSSISIANNTDNILHNFPLTLEHHK